MFVKPTGSRYGRFWFCFLLAICPLSFVVQAENSEHSGVSVGGLLFGDLYHVTSHHLPEGDGALGAVLRRGYLTLDGESASNWFGRLRLEANQSGEFETYDFEVDFKDAYLGYKTDRYEVIAGLQPTLTFDVIEREWGKRYLMRTPVDLQGVPSRDTGFSLRGQITDSLSYRAMVGVGQDFGAESGDGTARMLALNWRVNDQWAIDAYYDNERRPGEADVESRQIFASYRNGAFNAGAQYSYRDREAEATGELASVFGVWQRSSRSSLIGRIDRIIEPSIRGDNIAYIPFDPSAPATLYLGAYEYRLSDHLVVTPNTIVVSYDRNDEGLRPETDVYFRLTFFFDWE